MLDTIENKIDSPYPGLRPFSDHESIIFFGRDRQINEIINRLSDTHVVTVLGGSGSGKSSIVKAGVIPKLRQYGIPGAGHFWVPIVFTPGTNFKDNSLGPYQRLADALVNELDLELVQKKKKIKGDNVREITHRNIIKILNNPDGLSSFIDHYSECINLDGLESSESFNFLFVFDQFEEVFHATNTNNEEISTLVSDFIESLLLGHYNHPHKRAHVVITMRSEYLNDCARFINLPELVNKSSYLVARLKPYEIKQTIELPLKKYLRILVRENINSLDNYPDDICVDKNVYARILTDIEKLKHNPDHLPLLQHLLFRLWQVAFDRAKQAGDLLPSEINEQDLDKAIGEYPSHTDKDIFNLCLDYCANSLYRSLRNKKISRYKIQKLFTKMAYRDHNGKFSQQRVHLDDDPELLMITQAFTKPHSYLDFDEHENILKVSHESFIRGWDKYVEWLDNERKLIEQYEYVTKKFNQWESSGKKYSALLGNNEIKSINKTGLTDSIATKNWRGKLQPNTAEETYLLNKFKLSRGYEPFDFRKNETSESIIKFINSSILFNSLKRIPLYLLLIVTMLIPSVLSYYYEKKFYEQYFDLVQIEKKIEISGSGGSSQAAQFIPEIFDVVQEFESIKTDPLMGSQFFYNFSKFWDWIPVLKQFHERYAAALTQQKLNDLLISTTESKYFVLNNAERRSNLVNDIVDKIEQKGLDSDKQVEQINKVCHLNKDGEPVEASGTLITSAYTRTDKNTQPGIFMLLGGNQVYSASFDGSTCELVDEVWDLAKYVPKEILPEKTNDYDIFFNSYLNAVYKIWTIDKREKDGSKKTDFFLTEIPIELSAKTGNYQPFSQVNAFNTKLVFNDLETGSVQNNQKRNFILTNYYDKKGVLIKYANKTIRKTSYTTGAQNLSQRADQFSQAKETVDSWIMLEKVGDFDQSSVCREKKQEILDILKSDLYESKEIKYRWAGKITHDSGYKFDSDYCVVAVKKYLDSSPSLDIYFFSSDIYSQHDYIPVVRNFQDRGDNLFIGQGENRHWFGLSNTQGPQLVRPWNNIQIRDNVKELCIEMGPSQCAIELTGTL